MPDHVLTLDDELYVADRYQQRPPSSSTDHAASTAREYAPPSPLSENHTYQPATQVVNEMYEEFEVDANDGRPPDPRAVLTAVLRGGAEHGVRSNQARRKGSSRAVLENRFNLMEWERKKKIMYILILILSLIIIILASTGTWLMPDLEAYAEQYRVEQAREAYNPKACIGFGVESDVCGTRLIPQDCANITDSGDIIADVARQMCPYMCGANCTTTSTTGSTTTRTSTTGTTTTTIPPRLYVRRKQPYQNMEHIIYVFVI